MKRRRYSGLVLSALITLSAPLASAQQPGGFQLDRFEPLPDAGLNILNVSTSRILPSLQPSLGLTLHYVDDPLTVIRTDASQTLVDKLVDSALVAELAAGLGLFDYASLGVALPVGLSATGGDLAIIGRPGASVDGASIGDLRIITKIRFWYPEDAGGFGLHLSVPVWLPTGDPGRLGSDGVVRAQPSLGLDYRSADGFTLALNGGYHFRPQRQAHDLVSGPELRWAAAVELPTSVKDLSVVATLFGAVPLQDNRQPLDLSRPSDSRDLPVELLAGFRLRLGDSFGLVAGGGAGLGGAVGAPNYRVFAGVSFTPTLSSRDSDDDGVPDVRDGCIEVPEDPDGFQDEDGCPDLDNDGDGVPDSLDDCPLAAEDGDGFEDEDGCPDLDNDGDGIPDLEDSCPDAAEDVDGFEDGDGCPDLDNDGDGIPDLKDSCPHEAEDFDGYQDGDGCVDPDNDKDGILDVNDRCPDFPETFNSLDDEDGCPDTRSRYVQVYKDEIRLLRAVYFERRRATIRPLSFPVLDDVADVILSNAELTKVRIEGHTAPLGSALRELRLSEARARAVKAYLVRRGVDAHVLEAVGYGASRPIADNDTEAGRAQNRRVEFKIVEINGRPVTKRGTLER